jgi:hypothetical protein
MLALSFSEFLQQHSISLVHCKYIFPTVNILLYQRCHGVALFVFCTTIPSITHSVWGFFFFFVSELLHANHMACFSLQFNHIYNIQHTFLCNGICYVRETWHVCGSELVHFWHTVWLLCVRSVTATVHRVLYMSELTRVTHGRFITSVPCGILVYTLRLLQS